MSCSRETPVGIPRCMPARSSLLALVVRLSPSLFACRPRCSLVALAGRPSQFAPRRFSLAGRPSQFAPRSFPLAPQCPSRNSIGRLFEATECGERCGCVATAARAASHHIHQTRPVMITFVVRCYFETHLGRKWQNRSGATGPSGYRA